MGGATSGLAGGRQGHSKHTGPSADCTTPAPAHNPPTSTWGLKPALPYAAQPTCDLNQHSLVEHGQDRDQITMCQRACRVHPVRPQRAAVEERHVSARRLPPHIAHKVAQVALPGANAAWEKDRGVGVVT